MDARQSSRIAARRRDVQGDDMTLLPDPVQALSSEDGSSHPDPAAVHSDPATDSVVPIPRFGWRTN